MIIDTQQQSDDSTSLGFITALADLQGQTFIPAATGRVDDISLSLAIGLGAPDADLRLDLYSVSAGEPLSLLITAETQIAASSLTGAASSYIFSFDPSAIVNGAVQYAFVLRSENAILLDVANSVEIFGGLADPYPSGTQVDSMDSGSSWTITGAEDLAFTINIANILTPALTPTLSFLDPPDTVIAQLTDEGRGLLARAKLGNVTYRKVGYQIGRGGYQKLNPVKVIPFENYSLPAIGGYRIVDNGIAAGDGPVINSVPFLAGIAWAVGANAAESVSNIITAIQASINPLVNGVFLATTIPGDDQAFRLEAVIAGPSGNALPLSVIDTGTINFNFRSMQGGLTAIKQAETATAIVEIIDNTFDSGDALDLNGKLFTEGTEWSAGATIPDSVVNLVTAITDTTDPAVDNLVTAVVNPSNSNQLIIESLILGLAGNLYSVTPIDVIGTANFSLVQAMSGGVAVYLADPAFPVPPTLGNFVLPEGAIETPSPNAVSFVMRIPDGVTGLNAYGELGIYVEILRSNLPAEIGSQVLFAHAHFPIQAKTDRSLYTFRAVVTF